MVFFHAFKFYRVILFDRKRGVAGSCPAWVYLRFRNIITFCGVVQTYVHPLSISCPASLSSVAVAWW